MSTSIPQAMPSTRLLCMSDIHGDFRRFPIDRMPDADIAIVAGDITENGRQNGEYESDRARDWMKELTERYRRVLYVLGNHDLKMSPNHFDQHVFGTESESLFCEGIERNQRELCGLTFLGSSLSPCFDLPRLQFAWCRMNADPEADAAEWDQKPIVDTVVSHCPPEGILDSAGGRNIGSPGLKRYLTQPPTHKQFQYPRLVVCGHVHEAAGIESIEHIHHNYYFGETVVVNCARSIVLATVPRIGVVQVESAEV